MTQAHSDCDLDSAGSYMWEQDGEAIKPDSSECLCLNHLSCDLHQPGHLWGTDDKYSFFFSLVLRKLQSS